MWIILASGKPFHLDGSANLDPQEVLGRGMRGVQTVASLKCRAPDIPGGGQGPCRQGPAVKRLAVLVSPSLSRRLSCLLSLTLAENTHRITSKRPEPSGPSDNSLLSTDTGLTCRLINCSENPRAYGIIKEMCCFGINHISFAFMI